MIEIVVTCPSRPAHFDRRYYSDTHLPLAMATWQRHGIIATRALHAVGEDAPFPAIGLLRFRDEAPPMAPPSPTSSPWSPSV